MSINRGFTPNHKFYDEMGRLTPNFEWSESHRPHFEGAVAPWLPVVRYEKELQDWFVMSAGKVAAVDGQNDVVPAGYRLKFKVGGTASLVYTQDDIDAGVIDLTTGVTVVGTHSYSSADITTALRVRGLIRSTEFALDFISKPIGVAAYNYYKRAGTDPRNPATYYKQNWKPQELVAVQCDYVLIIPVLPAVATAEVMANAIANGAGALEANGFGTNGWFGSTAIHGSTRYASQVAAGDDLVCYVTSLYPIALNTTETPVTSNATGGLVNEKSTLAGVQAAGDWYIDREVGALFLYEAAGNAIPSPFAVTNTLTYYHYETGVAAGAARTSSYLCTTGDVKGGIFLSYNEDSNFVPAVLDISAAEGYSAAGAAYAADPEYDTETDNAIVSRQLEQAIMNYDNGVIGQVLSITTMPRDYLERVRTAFEGQSAANMRTPGSATQGRSDQLTYTNSAERLVIVNLINR